MHLLKRFLLLCLITLPFNHTIKAQNQLYADSIKLILENNDTLSTTTRMQLLNEYIISTVSLSESLEYSDELLSLAKKNKSDYYIASALLLKGEAYRGLGELKKGLEYIFESIDIGIDINNHKIISEGYQCLAMVYGLKNEIRKAIYYEKKSIDLVRANDKHLLETKLLNIGYSYYSIGEYDSAMLFYEEAYPIFENKKHINGTAYCIGNMALVYWKKGDKPRAIADLNQAIEMLIPIDDKYGLSDYHNQLAAIYLEQDDIQKAIYHTETSLKLSRTIDQKEQIRDALLLLSKLYVKKKNYKNAFEYQNLHMLYKDSIADNDQAKTMADMRTDFEVNIREKEIDILEKKQKINRISIAAVLFLLTLSVMVLLYFRQRFKTTKLVTITQKKQHEKEVSDMLNKEQTRALQTMIQGRDNERKRLAKELHNHFGSLLATVKVNLNGIDDQSSPKFNTINQLVDQACTDIREMSHTLNLGVSENFGLIPSLKELVNHLKQSGKLSVEFSATMGSIKIITEHEIVIYRVIQELISNVLKHAEATKLSILLTCFEEEKIINIMVQDNGKGFNPQSKQKDDSGIGLSALDEMIDSLNGTLNIDSNPNSGTSIIIDLPIIEELTEAYD